MIFNICFWIYLVSLVVTFLITDWTFKHDKNFMDVLKSYNDYWLISLAVLPFIPFINTAFSLWWLSDFIRVGFDLKKMKL